MINPVDPGQLLQFITTFSTQQDEQQKKGNEEMETESSFITRDNMTAEQRDLVDDVQEEHEDFSEPLAMQAINELGKEANIGGSGD